MIISGGNFSSSTSYYPVVHDPVVREQSVCHFLFLLAQIYVLNDCSFSTKFFKECISNTSFYLPKRATINVPKIVVAAMKVITLGLHDRLIVHLPFSHGSWLCSCVVGWKTTLVNLISPVFLPGSPLALFLVHKSLGGQFVTCIICTRISLSNDNEMHHHGNPSDGWNYFLHNNI